MIDAGLFAIAGHEELKESWRGVLSRLPRRLGCQPILLLREGDAEPWTVEDFKIVRIPAVDFRYSAVEDRRLAQLARQFGADCFLSTCWTSAGPGLPSLYVEFMADTGALSEGEATARRTAIDFALRHLAFDPAAAQLLATDLKVKPESLPAIASYPGAKVSAMIVSNFVATALGETELTQAPDASLARQRAAEERMRERLRLERPEVYGAGGADEVSELAPERRRAFVEEALRRNPESPRLNLCLADLISTEGDYASFRTAEACYEKWLQSEQGAHAALPRFAQVLWVNGKTPRAIELMRRYLAGHGDAAPAYSRLGMYQLAARQYLDAFMAYSTALGLDPNMGGAKTGRECAKLLLKGIDLIQFKHKDGETIKFHITGQAVTADFAHLAGQFVEEPELQALRKVVPQGGNVVDVGCEIGNHAVYFQKYLKAARIWAFDANQRCTHETRRNLQANAPGSECRFDVLTTGVSDKPGKLYLPQHDDTVSGLSSNPDEGIEVPVVPLDNLVGERVDLLKVDVEGMEMQVLKGAMNILRRDRPYLFIEVQDANREAFSALMNELGYKLVARFGGNHYTNVLCAHPSRDRQEIQPEDGPAIQVAQQAFGSEDYWTAIKALRPVVERRCENQPLRQMLATACFAQFLLDGSNEARSEAADNLFQLVRRNDRNGPAWKMLAQISAATGDAPAARQFLQRAVEADPNDQQARKMLEAGS